MNKIAAAIVENKVKETASAISEAAEEMITMSRRTHTLEILVALLGGIVIGMFLSPRKKVSYKIASNNHDIGGIAPNKPCDEDEDDDYDEDDDDAGDSDEDEDDDDTAEETQSAANDKFIKL